MNEVQQLLATMEPPAFVATQAADNAQADSSAGPSSNAAGETTGSNPPKKRRRRSKVESVQTPVDPARVAAIREIYKRVGKQTAKVATSWNAKRLTVKADKAGLPIREAIEKGLIPAESELDFIGDCCGELAGIYGLDPTFGPLGGLLVVASGYITTSAQIEKQIDEHIKLQKTLNSQAHNNEK